MKVEVSQASEKVFQPFDIRLTFETAKDADVFYALLNHSDICDWLRYHGVYIDDAVREIIDRKHKDLDYHTYFSRLADVLKGDQK